MVTMIQQLWKRHCASSGYALLLISVLLGGSSLFSSAALAAEALDLDALLRAVNGAAAEDRKVNRAREAEFTKKKQQRQQALNRMSAERQKQEKLSTQLERNFNDNEQAIVELQEELRKELGDLKELFGVIQQTASEAQENYRSSLISAQYPERADKLQQLVAKMASLTELVSINEIEELWFHLQNELVEQGRIVQLELPVHDRTFVGAEGSFVRAEGSDNEAVSEASGNDNSLDNSSSDNNAVINNAAMPAASPRTVTRIGVFNAVSERDIVFYEDGLGLVLHPRQMAGEFTDLSVALQAADGGVSSFLLDPTQGALLSALAQKPTLFEKVQEGKIIGYAILALGALAVLVAASRLAILALIASGVKKQLASASPDTANPLGRVIAAFNENPSLPVESMSLIAEEAIKRESPKLNRGVMLIKMIAVVAPLLGLLGTVTGMIQTFQAITLFGAGDPQMMAAGISQALVTTVLGLVVAIPAVFLHWLASARAQQIEEILEEKASGLLASRQAA